MENGREENDDTSENKGLINYQIRLSNNSNGTIHTINNNPNLFSYFHNENLMIENSISKPNNCTYKMTFLSNKGNKTQTLARNNTYYLSFDKEKYITLSQQK